MTPWFQYDSQADALTIYLAERARGMSARTVDAGHGRLVDFDADGNVVFIEVLEVSNGFFLDDVARELGLEAQIAQLAPRLPAQFYRPAVTPSASSG